MGDDKANEILDLARRAVKKIERSSFEEDFANSLSRAGTEVDVKRVRGSGGSSQDLAFPPDDSRTRQHCFPSIASHGSPVPPVGSPTAARRDIFGEQQGAAFRLPEPSSCPESGETLYICEKGRLNFLPRPPVSAEERLRWLEDDEGACGRSRAHCRAPSGEGAEGRVISPPVPIWENLQWLDEAPCGRKKRPSFVPKFLKRLWSGTEQKGVKASGL